MAFMALFIIGLVIALIVAFSRIGSLEREVGDLRDSVDRLRARRTTTEPEPQRARIRGKPLPAHLQPVAPRETGPSEVVGKPHEPVEPPAEPPEAGESTGPVHQPPPVPPPPRPADRAAPAASDAGSDFEQRVASFWRSIGPSDPNMTWETAIGTYWLPRLAAVFLSVASVLFLTLALQRFGPVARIAVGYAVTAAFLGGAFWLERKYAAYARVLYGLGLALLYLVTFATHYFPPARVFDNPLITLLLLAAIISYFIGLAQWRRSPTIALVALLLGHFTTGLASFTLDDPGLYSGAGILVLSLGGAWFLLRDRWYAIAAVGMLGSYANHFLLMMQSESRGLPSEFAIGIGVLSGYYLIYALAELFAHEDARKAMPNWFRSAFVSVNTACYFALGTLLVDAFEFSEDWQHVFRYALAIVLFAFGIAYLRVRGRDPMYNTYLTKGSAALTLGLAAQFSGATLTATLAVQMVVLLVTARRSGLVVTRVLAFLVAGVAILHGAFIAADVGVVSRDGDGYSARVVQYALTVLAFLAAGKLYEWTDWTRRSPRKLPVPDGMLDLLWQLDLVAEPSLRGKPPAKPLQGHLFPGLYAAGGALLYLLFAFTVTEPGERYAAYAIAALVLAVVGRVLDSPSLVAAFLIPLVGALVAGTAEAFAGGFGYAQMLPGVVPLLVLGWLAEPRIAGAHRSLALLQAPFVAFAANAAAAWTLVLYLTQLHDPPRQLLIVAGAAVYFAALSFAVTPAVTGYVSKLVLLAAHLLWYPYSDETGAPFHLVTATLAALAVAGDRLFSSRALPGAGPALVLSAVAVLIRYAYATAGADWAPVAWVVLAVAAGAYAAATRSWAAAAGAGTAGVLASVQQLAISYPDSPATNVLVAGFLAAAGFWIAAERAAKAFGKALDPIRPIAVAAATVLLLCLLERSPALREFYLTISWSLLGFALFALALAFGEKYYRYAALSVILLASGRVLIIDTVNLEPMPRILAWFILGLVMLALGFGYVKAFPPGRSAAEHR